MKSKGVRSFDLDVFLTGQTGGGGNRKYKKDDVIFTQGDPCDGVFYVQEGKCKIAVVSERGKEAVVALHEKGDFFGEGCLTGQPRRLATATAMTDCELLRLDSATIERVIHEQVEFAEFFIARVLARNARVEADLVDQLFNSSEKRLARQRTFRHGRKIGTHQTENRPSHARRNDRHHSVTSELLYEQVSQARFNRLQRRYSYP